MKCKYYYFICIIIAISLLSSCSGKDLQSDGSGPIGATVVINIICYGDSTGAVDLTVSGGISPYSFLWNNGAITEDITNIPAGNYNVTITDAKGHEAKAFGIVAQPSSVLSVVTVVTDVAREGDASGAVSLTVSGGISPYTYLWSNGATTKDITNVIKGNYTVTITGANGCKVIKSGNVKENGNPMQKIPNQGGFRNGQAMWDWVDGAGNIWWDGGNPIYAPGDVVKFVSGNNSDAMNVPRPKKVKLYMQGNIPRLAKYTYTQSADNYDQSRKDWVAIAQTCVDAGYIDCVFGSSETQTDSKPWMPTADDIESGRWKKAWMNMVDAVRSVMPGAKFAFVPMSGGNSSEANPDNGILEKDKWYIAEKDNAGRPYMDFWGNTFYFGTRGANCGGDCPVTKDVIDLSMAALRIPAANCHTDWGLMGNFQYAQEKGVKMVIGELGIFDRFTVDRYYGMGDQPYAIDLLTQLLSDYNDQIELVCWFNSRSLEGDKRVWSRLDEGSSMPAASQRVKELWGTDSPYRK